MDRLLRLVVLIGLGAAALCATTFTWTEIGTAMDLSNNTIPITASGTLIANPIGGGAYVATSGSGIVNGDAFTLYPGPGDGSPFSHGWFSVDNQLFPESTALLDSRGLIFVDAAGGNLNIYLPGLEYGYSAILEDGNFLWGGGGMTFTLSEAAPEPSALSLGLFAAAALFTMRRRSRRIT
jgi:hypothetical protein